MRKVTISILLLVMVFTGGCIDVTYKTEVGFKIGNTPILKKDSTPVIVGDSRFHHAKVKAPVTETKEDVETIERGFSKFKN